LLEAAANDSFRDIMSALGNANGHSLDRQFFILKPKKDEMNAVAALLPVRDQLRVSPSGESGFEGETDSVASMPPNLFKHQPARANGDDLGRKWRNTLGNQVGINEDWAAGFVGQVFQSEGGFTGAIGSGNDDDSLLGGTQT